MAIHSKQVYTVLDPIEASDTTVNNTINDYEAAKKLLDDYDGGRQDKDLEEIVGGLVYPCQRDLPEEK